MGSNFDYSWAPAQAFAAGQVGMVTGGADLYTWMIQNAGPQAGHNGITTIPLEMPRRRRPRRRRPSPPSTSSRPSRARSGRRWIDFYYIQKLITRRARSPTRRRWPPTASPWRAALPIFDKATRQSPRSGSRTTSTSRSTQMTPFTSKISTSRSSTSRWPTPRRLYAALDPVVQAVLTDQNADIDALLDRPTPRSRRVLDAG